MRTTRQMVDYALQRRALLAQLHAGRVSMAEVCDAGPYLLRAATFHGQATGQDCPVCRKERVISVSWVYGDELGQASGSARTQDELVTMSGLFSEFRVFVVEVCRGCKWNHLTQSYVLGTPGRSSGKARRRTAGQ